MPGRLISIFGTYDFLAKSLPGTTLVIGTALLLPEQSINVPNLSQNFLVLVSILVVAGLMGTLIGEFVHGVSLLLERSIAIIGRFLKKPVISIARWRGWTLVPPDPKNVSQKKDGSGIPPGESNWYWIIRKLKRHKLSIKIRIHRVLYETVQIIRSVLWSHRKLFKKYITDGLDEPYKSVSLPVSGASFTQQHIHRKMVNKFEVKNEQDVEEIYPVVVSTLNNSKFDRSFRFQARSAFCRSMSMVFISLSFLYITSVVIPIEAIPQILRRESYLSYYLASVEIWGIGILLFLISLVFAWASGSYKKHYVQYLIAETYAMDFESGPVLDWI